MKKWTASVNIFMDDEQSRYSVRLWRVGAQNHTFRRPNLWLHGRVAPADIDDPRRWLWSVLGDIRREL